MIFHENRLLTILKKNHILFFSKTRKDVPKVVVCCSRDCALKVKAMT